MSEIKIFEIIDIELENIKTYIFEKIDFLQGNNVLIGENGAGKSTILESIYLALFGETVPGRNLGDMIRFGEQQGKITIRFTIDNILYRIEDIIVKRSENRTTQNQVLVNQDSGDTIAEGRNAVRAKIEELLDVDATTFISAVYASQGEIGKIITDKDSDRKKLFDKLFQIERFEKTWSNLSKIEKIINNNIISIENKLQTLSDDLIDLPEKHKQLELKKKQLNKESKNLHQLNSKYDEIEQKYKVIEKLVEKHNKLLTEKNLLIDQVNNITNSINSQFHLIKEKLDEEEIVCSLKSLDKIKKKNQRKIEQILEQLNNLRDNEQSIKINLEKINNLEQNKKIIELAIIDNKNELDNEINDYSLNIPELTKKIENWEKKIPELIENSQLKINRQINKKEKLEEKITELTKLKIELKTKEEVVNKTHNKIIHKRLILAQDIGENWRGVIDELSVINFEDELQKITIKIDKFEMNNTNLIKQKSVVENSISRIKGNLQHLKSLKGKETCPTCKQNLSKEKLEELCSILENDKQKFQDDMEVLSKQLIKINQEIINSKNHEKELRKQNQLYNNSKPIFDEIIILENEKLILDNEVKKLAEKLQKLSTEYNEEQIIEVNELLAFEEDHIKDINAAKKILPKLVRIKEKIALDSDQINKLAKEISQLKIEYNNKNLNLIDKTIKNKENEHKKYNQNLDELNQLIKDLQNKDSYQDHLKKVQKELLEIENKDDFTENEKFGEIRLELGITISSKKATIKSLKNEVIPPLVEQINKLEKKEKELKEKELEIIQEKRKREITTIIRGIMRELPNRLLPNYIERINKTASEILQSIIPGSDIQNIVLNDDYSLNVIRLGNFENISVLSGGETIIIALALRLAFAKEFSTLDLLILDEPTIFLDEQRRGELVAVLEKNRLVRQMFVVTHDPDFERISDKTYFIKKIAGETSIKTSEEENIIDSSFSDITLK